MKKKKHARQDSVKVHERTIYSHVLRNPVRCKTDKNNTGFIPFFKPKIQGLIKTFKDTFPIFQGLHSVQKRALNLFF